MALLFALLPFLLIVELGAAIGAVLEQDIPTSVNTGAVIGASPEAKAFFWRAGVEVSLVHPREEGVKNGPTLAEIRHRAFEIHIERGGIHGCDLEDWLQAERELQEKYNKSNDGGPKKK